VARALIVGCGCRGRDLGTGLIERGWVVRGATRDPTRIEAIEGVGIEPAVADPDRIGTVIDELDGVSVIYWLLGSAAGPDDTVAALHGARLERLLAEIVDTPVRGLVYEAAGSVAAELLEAGSGSLAAARERWRLRGVAVEVDPADGAAWTDAMLAAADEVLRG
jgi:uncharacterized protein YbjT (DUF2867 family)